MSTIANDHFTNALKMMLDEVFDNVHGFILDKGDSLFETLAGIDAQEASIPVGGQCATLAAQVKHTAFYLDATINHARDPNYRADWVEIWRTIGRVTPGEWKAIKAELRASYDRILQFIDDTPAWSNEAMIGGAIAVVAHTAYHLGQIRQSLCTLNMQKITTFLMFDGKAEEAMNLYTSLFKGSKIVNIARYGPNEAGAEGSVMHATFTLNGQEFMAIDSNMKHEFTFTPSMSLYVRCESEAEIDALFATLSQGGEVMMPLDRYPFSQKFGWLADKFGVSWQLTLEKAS
jgi:predicted 3-demethylubiquinone-9 3-methyltransferase (glyoxalase superfamily)